MRIAIIITALLLVCCNSSKENLKSIDTVFVRLDGKESGINFQNKLLLDEDFDVFRYRNYYNGGGVAIVDVNNDGFSDVFLTSNMGDNQLFLNKGDWKFTDITRSAGIAGTKKWSTGVSVADVNADGYLDIYVCNSGDINGDNRQNELFINNGDLTFTDRATEFGLADNGFSTHAVFFDYDKDGDLDCYVLNNSFRPISTLGYRNLRNERDETGGDKLYNNQRGKFIDVSEYAGIFGSVIGFGLGVTVGDVDQDNWPDIYVSNDFYERDYLYVNNHNGTFTEKLPELMGHLSMFSMGADLADINNDGYPDIFSTDMLPESDYRLKTLSDFESYDVYQLRLQNDYYHQFMRNMLQLNNKDGTFSEIGQLAGVDATDWSWGALIADFDNDSKKEIFVCNGIYKDVTNQDFVNFLGSSETMHNAIDGKKVDFKEFIDKMTSQKLSNYLFVSTDQLQYQNKAESWGLDEPSFSNGAAYGDLDNDGDLDLVVNNVNQEAFVYKNQSQKNGNHSLTISFKGDALNTFGIGATVKAYLGNEVVYLENIPMRGFQSSMDYKMLLGTKGYSKVDSIRVTWPSGKSQRLTNVETNKNLILNESDAVPVKQILKEVNKSLLVEAKIEGIEHVENQYNDFDYDRLMYHMLSTQGPALASADLNGDGLDDFFLGGSKGHASTIYYQKNSGSFVKGSQGYFDADSLSEDLDASFFDADGDNDLDLFVVSGGSDPAPKSGTSNDRLYENKGVKNGEVVYAKTDKHLPSLYHNRSCVKPADIDNDGDIDLFVGSRLMQRYYGLPCDQTILVNNGKGFFEDKTSDFAPELRQYGMVTDAQWSDYDNDGYKDLFIVGEWLPIAIFKNDGKGMKLVKNSPGLDNSNGWWNRIEQSDLDGDGDLDFIVGNLGLNSKFKPTHEAPISLFVNDFDQNGSIEPIFTFTKEGKDYPFALRQDIIKQMSSLKKKFVYFKDYADKSITDFIDPKILEKSTLLKFYEPRTSILINQGLGRFELHALPIEAQFSPVYGITVLDVNKDNNLDILLGGNLFSVKPEVGRYDAMHGLVLLGDGKLGFSAINSKVSGLSIKGEIRRISQLKSKNQNLILLARNNDSSKFYKLNK